MWEEEDRRDLTDGLHAIYRPDLQPMAQVGCRLVATYCHTTQQEWRMFLLDLPAM